MAGPRVLIVEDHQLLAHALAAALADHGVAAKVVHPADAGARAADADPGTVVVLDLALGDGIDGSDLVAPFRSRGARVLVVTGSTEVEPMARALEAGAVDVLPKSRPFAALLDAVRALHAGTYTPDARTCQEILRRATECRAARTRARDVLGRLTPREHAVLDALCRGHDARRIASDAGVALTTVRAQIRAILCKLGVRSQLQAVALAQELHRRAGVP